MDYLGEEPHEWLGVVLGDPPNKYQGIRLMALIRGKEGLVPSMYCLGTSTELGGWCVIHQGYGPPVG